MQPRNGALFGQFVLLCIVFAGLGFVVTREAASPTPEPTTAPAAAVTAVVKPATSTTETATSTPKKPVKVTTTVAEKPISKAVESVSATTTDTVKRVPQPYSTPPLSLAAVNERARAALVNILCTTPTGLLRPISGSGVIIDPRGVILTNAHVAQYVLLSESSRLNLECYVRTGSPASSKWHAHVLYIPSVWVSEHAPEIASAHVLGTGEHDYALLYIVSSVDGSPSPGNFAFLPPDVREGTAFMNDAILVASYPAEFLGGLAATNSLYAASAATTVRQLLTFGTDSVDALSLGGVIVAQSGSSGGPAANLWGYLVGLITTTSEGATTADRDLRAITLSYISRDLKAQAGSDLTAVLGGDPARLTLDFTAREAPRLLGLLLKQIIK